MLVRPATMTFRTRTGLDLFVRPLCLEDAPYLTDLFAHLGPESRYLRFNQALSNPDPALVQAEARRLARVDPEEGAAWLAFADLPGEPHAPLAGARFIRTGPGVAEASIAVRDDAQRQGIGAVMLDLLVREARRAGIHTLTAVIQYSNNGIWRLLKQSGLPYRRGGAGTWVEIFVDIAARPDDPTLI